MPVEEKLLALVVQSELEIPHPISRTPDSFESYIREKIYGKWQALKNWFLAHDGRPSECSQ
jgi:hypothetical protein